MATLVPCLVKLRSGFNELAPDRDKDSDGWIGDPRHQANPTSDHNPALDGQVHAIDVDEDLRVPGLSMERVVQFLLARCRSGAENRLKYIIYERRIWSASTGWRQEHYSGANAHDKHAHFSASYTPAREASTASWNLEDIPVALTADDKKWISAEIAKQVKGCIDDIWAFNIGKAAGGAKADDLTARGALRDTTLRADGVANETLPLVADNVGALVAGHNQIKATIDEIKAVVTKAVPQGK